MALTREEIALRIFCALLRQAGSVTPDSLGENEARVAFVLAQTFERVSDEVGGRPVHVARRHSAEEDWDDD